MAAATVLAAVSGTAAARSVPVPLPSAGDITVAHLVFKRGGAQAAALPHLRLIGKSTRSALRRYRVGVVGGSFRLSGKRVVASVLLMRQRPAHRVARTPRGATAQVTASAPIASATVERNAIADLRRGRARASGEEANAPSACGETGLFSLLSGDTLPPGNFSFGLYYNNWDRLIDFSDPAIERDKLAELRRLTELGYAIACGQTARLDSDAQLWLDDFIKSLGATPPGPSCPILTTYVGPATDGEGHILTQPVVNISLSCSVTINGVTITIPDHVPTFCGDSLGNDCMIEGNQAVFPFMVPPFENRGYSVTTDPPLMRGDVLDMDIETPRGVAHEHAVM